MDMITATLGGLIKDYRIKKRLSQIDVSVRLGWKESSRISRIEQEKGYFLLVGGYLPTDNEVQNILFLLRINNQ